MSSCRHRWQSVQRFNSNAIAVRRHSGLERPVPRPLAARTQSLDRGGPISTPVQWPVPAWYVAIRPTRTKRTTRNDWENGCSPSCFSRWASEVIRRASHLRRTATLMGSSPVHLSSGEISLAFAPKPLEIRCAHVEQNSCHESDDRHMTL